MIAAPATAGGSAGSSNGWYRKTAPAGIAIGRFAKLTDLSQRLLRRLDERGLLSPVLVDPDTRYRYYDIGQTRVAGLIHLDKQTGTIKVGKRADLVVLDTDLLKVADPTDLFKAHVLFTMGSGQVLYDTL